MKKSSAKKSSEKKFPLDPKFKDTENWKQLDEKGFNDLMTDIEKKEAAKATKRNKKLQEKGSKPVQVEGGGKEETKEVAIAPQAPVGRQSIRTLEVENEIFTRLAKGESLNKICEDEHLPHSSTVYDWLAKDKEFADNYVCARDMYADVAAEEIIEISDNGTNDWMQKNDPENPGYVLNGEHVQRSKLRIDARKWIAAKLKPKKYGDSIKIETETTIASDSGNLDPEKLLSTAEYLISSCLDLAALESLKLKLEDVIVRKRSEGAKIING